MGFSALMPDGSRKAQEEEDKQTEDRGYGRKQIWLALLGSA